MASQTAAIWAAATGAAVVVGGAAAGIYWAHPAFLWPIPTPAAVVAQAPATPPPAAPAAATPKGPSAAAPAAPHAPDKPSFDVVSVEPTGETVVAGRAAPNAKVELKDSGKTLAEATANAEGQFVIIPPTLSPGEHSLALSAGAGASAQTSNAITVAVAAPALAPRATTEASVAAPSSPPVPASATAMPLTVPGGAAGPVAVQSMEASAGGRLVAKGAAPPNAVVRLYLSGAYIGDAKTKADGRWSLTIEHGLTPGAYNVRADEINPADATVEARAEAPFTYPAMAADAPAPPTSSPSAPADVVVDSVQIHHVDAGNTLWGISQKFYGDGSRYEVIYAANSSQIRDPHWIYPGQVLVVPKAAPKP